MFRINFSNDITVETEQNQTQSSVWLDFVEETRPAPRPFEKPFILAKLSKFPPAQLREPFVDFILEVLGVLQRSYSIFGRILEAVPTHKHSIAFCRGHVAACAFVSLPTLSFEFFPHKFGNCLLSSCEAFDESHENFGQFLISESFARGAFLPDLWQFGLNELHHSQKLFSTSGVLK